MKPLVLDVRCEQHCQDNVLEVLSTALRFNATCSIVYESKFELTMLHQHSGQG